MLPTFKQGRKVVWNGITNDGMKFLDFIPPQLIKRKLDQEMMIEFTNGSIWQVVGSDDIDRLVGSNPVGVVYSEFSLTNPAAWDMVRPILNANGGWSIKIFTMRGKNHAYRLLEYAKTNPDWLADVRTVDDTVRPDGLPIIDSVAIDEDRASGTPEEIIQQEYWCSPEAQLVGSYYGDQMGKMEAEGRICDLPYDPTLPVHTAWDIGLGDATAIPFFQVTKEGWINIIDYAEQEGWGLDKWVKHLDQKAFKYGTHLGPHDLKQREWGGGARTRLQAAQQLGLNFTLVPKLKIAEGISAVRSIMPRLRIDKKRCERLIDCLKQYSKQVDTKAMDPDGRKMYKDAPLHDWTSNGADSVRYLAVGIDFIRNSLGKPQHRRSQTKYDMITHNKPTQQPISRYNNPWSRS
jgi:hypothetical protein